MAEEVPQKPETLSHRETIRQRILQGREIRNAREQNAIAAKTADVLLSRMSSQKPDSIVPEPEPVPSQEIVGEQHNVPAIRTSEAPMVRDELLQNKPPTPYELFEQVIKARINHIESATSYDLKQEGYTVETKKPRFGKEKRVGATWRSSVQSTDSPLRVGYNSSVIFQENGLAFRTNFQANEEKNGNGGSGRLEMREGERSYVFDFSWNQSLHQPFPETLLRLTRGQKAIKKLFAEVQNTFPNYDGHIGFSFLLPKGHDFDITKGEFALTSWLGESLNKSTQRSFTYNINTGRFHHEKDPEGFSFSAEEAQEIYNSLLAFAPIRPIEDGSTVLELLPPGETKAHERKESQDKEDRALEKQLRESDPQTKALQKDLQNLIAPLLHQIERKYGKNPDSETKEFVPDYSDRDRKKDDDQGDIQLKGTYQIQKNGLVVHYAKEVSDFSRFTTDATVSDSEITLSIDAYPSYAPLLRNHFDSYEALKIPFAASQVGLGDTLRNTFKDKFFMDSNHSHSRFIRVTGIKNDNPRVILWCDPGTGAYAREAIFEFNKDLHEFVFKGSPTVTVGKDKFSVQEVTDLIKDILRYIPDKLVD